MNRCCVISAVASGDLGALSLREERRGRWASPSPLPLPHSLQHHDKTAASPLYATLRPGPEVEADFWQWTVDKVSQKLQPTSEGWFPMVFMVSHETRSSS